MKKQVIQNVGGQLPQILPDTDGSTSLK